MAERWTTVAEAAKRLNVSTRTVERRINAGDLESRLTPSGRREVLTDTEPTPADNWHDSLSVVTGHAQQSLSIAATTIDATRQLADAHAVELRRARRIGLAAWLTVAALALAILAGGGWTVRHLTATEADLTATTSDLTAERTRAEKLTTDLADTTGQLEAAHADRRKADAKAEDLQARIDELQAALLAAERARAEALAKRAEPTTWRAWLARLARP